MDYGRENIQDGLFAEIAEEARRLGILRPHTDAERAASRARMLAGLDADTFTIVAAQIDRQAYDGRL